ncbi:M13-type metalloendopeptidase [Xanthomonas arboricola]|uniref:M13-type metalloendopeptidase n=1 Tax=Xanthomonas arboricola TaxID=56448 RepID=UPI000A6F08D9
MHRHRRHCIQPHPEHALTINGCRPERRFFPGFARNWREQIREQQQLVYLAPGPHAPSSLRANAVPRTCRPSYRLSHARQVLRWCVPKKTAW